MHEEWTEWDAADDISSPEDAAAFLNAVLELDDPQLIPDALGVLARARGMSAVAERTGLGRESLYKSLSEGGNPQFVTVAKVLSSMGLTLRVAPKQLASM